MRLSTYILAVSLTLAGCKSPEPTKFTYRSPIKMPIINQTQPHYYIPSPPSGANFEIPLMELAKETSSEEAWLDSTTIMYEVGKNEQNIVNSYAGMEKFGENLKNTIYNYHWFTIYLLHSKNTLDSLVRENIPVCSQSLLLPTPNDLFINRKIKDHFDSTEWTYKIVSEFGITTCKPKEEFSIMSPEEVKQTGKDMHYFFSSSIKKGKTLDDSLNNINRLFKNVISIDFKSKADIWKSAGPIPVKKKYKP